MIVAGIVAAESMGVPLPGETGLITAAIFAGETHRLNIWLVVASAAAGAFTGGAVGYLVGRTLGHRFLIKHGAKLGMDARRIKLGQYLFKHHGGKVVFFGRFVALLRTYAAFLAGTMKMPWPRFLVFNAAGGIVWALVYGLGFYYFGSALTSLRAPADIALAAAAVIGVVGGIVVLRRKEKQLGVAAEQAYPGPLE